MAEVKLSTNVDVDIAGVAKYLVEAIGENLVAQGHKRTGKLLNSIEFVVVNSLRELGFDIYMEHYGAIVDKGVEASRVPFTIGSGAKKSKYIDALIKWAKTFSFITSQKEAKSFAFAVAIKHKKEGIPTSGSYAFSDTGERTDFFTGVVEAKESIIEEMLLDIIGREVQIVLDDLINDIQKSLN
jgi:hypothetical protein